METKFNPEWSAAVALLFVYLTTIPFWRATRILSLWNQEYCQFDQFANMILAGIPQEFFLRSLPVPTGPHYVIKDQQFYFDGAENSTQTPIQPEDLRSYLEEWGPRGEATNKPPKRLKVLNSFMAFRCEFTSYQFSVPKQTNIIEAFIAPLFDMPQKAKSPLISHIWTDDPYKAQWQVIALAYSKLRDDFDMQDTRLATFIDIAKDLFQFPTPDLYIKQTGWKIQCNDGNEFDLVKILPVHSFTVPDLISVTDVLVHCLTVAPGYAQKKPTSLWPYPGNEGLAEAVGVKCSGESYDPFEWLLTGDGTMNSQVKEFTLEDLYDFPSCDMNTDADLIFEPQLEQNLRLEKANNEEVLIDNFSPGFPHLDHWTDWTTMPATHSSQQLLPSV
ncbi:Mating type protein [Penicillium verhagenii]|nr:Mating type protein [Penicillium verhagenii]